MNYLMERVSQLEWEWAINSDVTDDTFTDALERAIDKCESNPLICRLSLVVSPAFALKHGDFLQEKGFSVSGTMSADAHIKIRYTKLIRRTADGGRPAANPVQHIVSPEEQRAIEQNVAQADAVLSKFGPR